ncbi:hypothetical protein J0S82_007137 [Galemys pyrenaicus]|uniref:Uncharacterized protein n=1 Tax=Galemys pyrenaicus TaxID=202257 RepID=A0A8J6A7L5_GALPY|nr:hypothetical protein J0S82_007137 [Galemys pyrenaicus]
MSGLAPQPGAPPGWSSSWPHGAAAGWCLRKHGRNLSDSGSQEGAGLAEHAQEEQALGDPCPEEFVAIADYAAPDETQVGCSARGLVPPLRALTAGAGCRSAAAALLSCGGPGPPPAAPTLPTGRARARRLSAPAWSLVQSL